MTEPWLAHQDHNIVGPGVMEDQGKGFADTTELIDMVYSVHHTGIREQRHFIAFSHYAKLD